MLGILYTENVVQFCPLKEKQVKVPAEKLGDTQLQRSTIVSL